MQRPIEALNGQLDAARRDIDSLSERADASEALSAIDREMIADLQAEGVLSRDHAAQLDTALKSSRVIGAAIGIIMTSRGVSQEGAFTVLKEASQHSNCKLRELCADLVEVAGQASFSRRTRSTPAPTATELGHEEAPVA